MMPYPPEGYEEVSGGGLRPIAPPQLRPVRDCSGRRTAWTAADLMAETFAPPRMAVEGIIPEGLTFLAGAPKMGKSWMALGFSIAVASGGRALGSIPVVGGEVLYLALEDSPLRLQSRLRAILEGGVPPPGLEIHTEWPRLDEGGLEGLSDWLDAHDDSRLILVDVWPRIRPRPSRGVDHYQADYDAAEQLQRLAIARGIAVTTLYHTRKAGSDDFVETMQGTYGTAGAADTIVVVKRARGKADAVLYVTGRDLEEAELALRFTPQVGAWTLMGDAAEYAIGETRAEILQAVRDHGALSPKQAAEVTSVGHDLARQTMRRMAQDGQLKADHGRYSAVRAGTPVTRVTLSPDEDGSGDTVTGVTPLPALDVPVETRRDLE